MDHQSHQNVDQAQFEEKETNETWEWIKAIVIAVTIAFVIRIFIFSPIIVDGASMYPTLHDRERLIVNKFVYIWGEPTYGDVVVFHATENKDWIKRVIGLPGDTVEVRNDILYVNNKMVEEPYLDASKKNMTDVLTNDFYEVVPEGHVFVMGDNRRNSRDSRSIGPIPIQDIVGRADFVFWPISNLRTVK